jgi:predicted O-methyltransferase YrrM
MRQLREGRLQRVQVVGLLLLLAAHGFAQGRSMSDAEIRAYLPGMVEPGQREANIGAADGQYLHDLVVRLKAKRVLEIGTANGYSAIWLAMGLRKTGGQLITLEIHEAHQAAAREHLAATGLVPLVDARLADALEEVARLDGPFDLVLIDAIKTDYLRYYEMVLPKVRPGGVIAAHNVVSNRVELKDFLTRIRTDPAVRTEFFSGSTQGLSLSYKK